MAYQGLEGCLEGVLRGSRGGLEESCFLIRLAGISCASTHVQSRRDTVSQLASVDECSRSLLEAPIILNPLPFRNSKNE